MMAGGPASPFPGRPNAATLFRTGRRIALRLLLEMQGTGRSLTQKLVYSNRCKKAHNTNPCSALSDVQEAAQLLAGSEFPVAVMTACITGQNVATLPAVKASRLVRVINLTPYDGHFEKAMYRYHLTEDERPRICCLSVGQDPAVMQYSQSVLALSIMEDCVTIREDNDHPDFTK